MPCSGSVVRFAGGSNRSTDVSCVSLFLLIESSVELTSSMSVHGRSRLLIDHCDMEVEGVGACDPSGVLRVVGDGVLAINNLSLTPYFGDMTVRLVERLTFLVAFNFIVFLGAVLKGALPVSVDELVRRSNSLISVRYPASRPESMAESGSGVCALIL